MTFEAARARFPVLERAAYLNTGTFGPLSRATAEAIVTEQRRALEEGRAGHLYFDHVMTLRGELRERFASLVGVEASQVALTASVTDGCNIVLGGLGLDPGDEVVTTTDEHFGMLGPLHASGARVVVVPPDPDAILAAVTARTRLLALSHVLWTTGQILPVHELRRQAGIPILVDGAQSVGAIPVDAKGLDFHAMAGQKWLCGPDATGALVVEDPERLRIARPGHFAQERHEPDGSYVPRTGARRFDPNWWPTSSIAGLLAALSDLPEWRYERAAETAERLRERLAPYVEVQVPAERATLVSFAPPGGVEAAELVHRLFDAGVVVRDLPGRELVRASVGWWTSDEDLDRLVDGVAA